MLGVDATSVGISPTPGVFLGLPADKREAGEVVWIESGRYLARLARTAAEQEAAFRLRFLVFNLEMREGLDAAFVTGLDTDLFDPVCDHLVVEDRSTGAVVGTYRMQRGCVAARHLGYYSEQEFDFAPYGAMRGEIVELGRACVHREHRSPEVLHLLWRGVARYSLAHGARYMMGCCSLTSQDPEEGHAVYRSLRSYGVEPELRTRPTELYAMAEARSLTTEAKAPKLLRAYLTIGARICGTPAIDRAFKTIDFLTILDLEALHPRMAARFLHAR